MPDKYGFTVILMRDHLPKTPAAQIRSRQGADLRKFRDFKKLSQQAVADTVGVSKAAVSSWERGETTPRQHLQVAVAKALDVPWSSIFGLDREAVA